MKDRLFDLLMPLIPKNELSHLVGKAVHKELPEPIARHAVALFAKYYSIDLDEAEHPISHYKSIGELFTRKLKAGIRPIGKGSVVHPADAKISEAGTIENQTIIQAKGKDYKVAELLRSKHYADLFDGGSYLTYYLCPTDYHRVHSPVTGRIIWSCHVPGELWPVNEWSVNAIANLFSVNERVVAMIETPQGLAALVMVAATNVGNMTMSFDPAISTKHRSGERHARERVYDPPIDIGKGDEIGIFHMGSTVVMLYQKDMLPAPAPSYRGTRSKVGESL